MTRARRTRWLAAAAALVATGALVPGARGTQSGVDLTGVWTGKIVCKDFDAGVKDKFTLTPTMKITQIGPALGLVLDYGKFTETYTGYVDPDAKKPLKGQLALIACGTDDVLGNEPAFDEIATISVASKPPKVKATFRGPSVFSDAGTPAVAGSCRWSWKRTSLTDPNVPLACAM